MYIKIALIISAFLQFATAIIALSLVKRTRTNIAWWLISFAFLLMAFRRIFEVMQYFDSKSKFISGMLSSWTGVLVSILMLLSLIFIKRIFNIQKRINELRKQNESRILSAIIKTEEHERQYFAKELHDGLGPLLAAVKMALSSIKYQEKKDGPVLENTKKLIDESIATLKSISNKLSPHILNNFGLYKAVKSFINKLPTGGTPQIIFNSNTEGKRFPFNIEVVMYRVIGELISNTLKHADAKSIRIELHADESTISLQYTDNGVGFDLKETEQELIGMGYYNIKSRVKSLNGYYNMSSKKGEGIRVNLTININ